MSLVLLLSQWWNCLHVTELGLEFRFSDSKVDVNSDCCITLSEREHIQFITEEHMSPPPPRVFTSLQKKSAVVYKLWQYPEVH